MARPVTLFTGQWADMPISQAPQGARRVPSLRCAPMRRALTLGYSGLGWLIVALGVLQFFLAGLGIFGSGGFDAHESVGRALHGVTILVIVLAIAGPRTGRDIGMSVVLFLITTLQTFLPELRDDAAWAAAFHPVLALAILGLAAHIGRRYIGGGEGASGAAAPA